MIDYTKIIKLLIDITLILFTLGLISKIKIIFVVHQIFILHDKNSKVTFLNEKSIPAFLIPVNRILVKTL